LAGVLRQQRNQSLAGDGSTMEHEQQDALADRATSNVSRGSAWSCAVLIAALLVVGGYGAWCLAGLAGLAILAFLLSAAMLFDISIPARVLLRAYKAELLPADDSQLSSLVDVLAWRAGLPNRPSLYVIPSLTMTTFCCGPLASPAVAVSEGLLRRLTLRETAAMIAHEMAHIRNGDLTVFALADALTRVSQVLAYAAIGVAIANLALGVGDEWLAWPLVVLMYAAPLLTNALQQRLPRSLDFEADATAIALTGDVASFEAALRRLESFEAEAAGTPLDDIRLPVPGRRSPHPSLLRTPPLASERIARLSGAAAQSEAYQPLVIAEQPRVSLVGYGPGTMRPRIHWTGVWY
jgi:heat shock protein HtpX